MPIDAPSPAADDRRMRPVCLAVLSAACVMLALAPASAEPGAAKPAERKTETRRPSTLDDLYARLAAAKDETEAGGIATLIERRLSRSASDTANLLLARSDDAIKAQDYPLAIELLDRVVTLQPGWAEPWNRRARAFFLLDDPGSAIADLRQALAREPRHFESWAALGSLFMSSDDKRHALEAYRQALKLHPFLSTAKSVVERIAPEIDGRDL